MVVFRGLRAVGRDVHRTARLSRGTWFGSADGTCVVGRRVVDRFQNMDLGGSFVLGQRTFKIVGVMEAGGAGPESEIWADLDDVVGAARRDWYNSVSVRLRNPGELASFVLAVTADPRVDLGVRSEPAYYAEQAGDAEGFRLVGLIVCFFMAIGACLAEMNTMYAAISSRTREIGTLRALGFGRSAILWCFVFESVLLAIPGGILGCLAGLTLNGWSMSVLSFATVSEVSFELKVSAPILGGAFVFSLLLGLLGGILPALQASRLPVLDALRKV